MPLTLYNTHTSFSGDKEKSTLQSKVSHWLAVVEIDYRLTILHYMAIPCVLIYKKQTKKDIKDKALINSEFDT